MTLLSSFACVWISKPTPFDPLGNRCFCQKNSQLGQMKQIIKLNFICILKPTQFIQNLTN
jgi:hypothetical protein